MQTRDGKNPNLSEWEKGETLYPINVERNNSLGQYAIVAENVPSRVCKMIGDSLKGQMDIYVGSETLKEKDTTTDPCDASDQNTMEFYFHTISCDPACDEGEYCDSGFCFQTSGKPRTWDSVCGIEGATCTTEDGENGFCESGTCAPLGTCTSNDECGPREYCAVVNYTSATERFPTGITGTCVKVNFLRYEVDGTTYYVSGTDMNWWNAEWACAKIGKEHLDIKAYYLDYGSSTEPSDLSIQLSNLIGQKYVWTATQLDSKHHITPLIGTTTNGLDMNKNNHDRLAVCK